MYLLSSQELTEREERLALLYSEWAKVLKEIKAAVQKKIALEAGQQDTDELEQDEEKLEDLLAEFLAQANENALKYESLIAQQLLEQVALLVLLILVILLALFVECLPVNRTPIELHLEHLPRGYI